jgi:glucose/arabinose dehydrogenase
VVDGLAKPDGIANAGDGSGRLFVLEQPGTVRIIKGGLLLTDPFLDIRDRAGSQGSEQGLLGIVFDPGYQQNGFFYVNYTDKSGNTVIARFKVSSNPDQADAASEVHILDVQQPYPNHNGGQLAFGPDGYLYIGLGDGGSQGDPHGNGQSIQTLLGKLLRIDVHKGSPYAIPPDNPFVKGGGRPEIWAYGLRNPWRFFFDPLTNGLYIADVGQDTWEEIDYVPPNYQGPTLNFGWNCREGLHPYKDCLPPSGSTFTDPVWEYDHSQGSCAIIGGPVYHGKELPGMDGVYLFGDYCSGLIWGLTQTNGQNWNANLLFQTNFLITSFGLDEAGEVYVADQHGGIYRLSQ